MLNKYNQLLRANKMSCDLKIWLYVANLLHTIHFKLCSPLLGQPVRYIICLITAGPFFFFSKSLRRSRFCYRMSDSLQFYPSSSSSSRSQASSPQAGLHTCEPCGTTCQQMAESQVLSCLNNNRFLCVILET